MSSIIYCLNPNCQQPQNYQSELNCASCGASILLGSRYCALKPIGQGGFGRTFLAVDKSQSDKPRCVIKQFYPPRFNSKMAIELFREEAERLKTLGSHPQIPAFIAYIEQDERFYIVQEFIEGDNLEQQLRLDGAFNEMQIWELLDGILPVLDFVHSHHVIHRDIKPENIIRSHYDGKLVLVDFGAAKHATGTALAQTGTTIGSAGYTAPEQTMGKATFASDLYSLGVTCIHLLTQVEPFELYSFSEDTWVWRDYLNTPVSNQLGHVLDKLLSRGTRKRYASASAVLQDKGALLPLPVSTTSGSVTKKERSFWRSSIVAVSVTGILGSATVAGIGFGVSHFLPSSNQLQIVHAPQASTRPKLAPSQQPVPQKPHQQGDELVIQIVNVFTFVTISTGSIAVIFGLIRVIEYGDEIGPAISPGIMMITMTLILRMLL